VDEEKIKKGGKSNVVGRFVASRKLDYDCKMFRPLCSTTVVVKALRY
jgi:hypothetical protein